MLLMLSDDQQVERKQRGSWSHRQTRIGLVTVTDPQDTTRCQVRGTADIFQMHLTRRDLTLMLESSSLSSIRPRFCEVDHELERCAYRALVALHDGDGFDVLLLSSIALQLSHGLVGHPPVKDGHAVRGLSPWQVNVVKELIASRLTEPGRSSPSLGEMAAEVDLSLHHFAREFRRTVGSTPHAYMLRQRLEAARSLLAYSNMSVSEIGRRTGFPSPAHFASRFRREMGIAPTDFRRAVQI